MAELIERDGYLAQKVLPDGREAGVMPMTFGKGRIYVCDANAPWIDDCWCYSSAVEAVRELFRWDGTGEPAGWIRHPSTGRRRPDGDPTKEYVMP